MARAEPSLRGFEGMAGEPKFLLDLHQDPQGLSVNGFMQLPCALHGFHGEILVALEIVFGLFLRTQVRLRSSPGCRFELPGHVQVRLPERRRQWPEPLHLRRWEQRLLRGNREVHHGRVPCHNA